MTCSSPSCQSSFRISKRFIEAAVHNPSSPDHSLDVDPFLLANLSQQENANADDGSWNVQYFRRFHVILKAGTFQMDSNCEIITDGSSNHHDVDHRMELNNLIQAYKRISVAIATLKEHLDVVEPSDVAQQLAWCVNAARKKALLLIC
jgi:hypothetical protein